MVSQGEAMGLKRGREASETERKPRLSRPRPYYAQLNKAEKHQYCKI